VRARATSILLAAAVVATASGCTFTAAQTNQLGYDPSDGFGAEVGDVAIRNALLITDDGETANLLINFINEGTRNVAVTTSWETADGRRVSRNVYLSAGTTRSYGEGTRIILSGIDATVGSQFPVYFQYGDEEGTSIEVPVLDDTLAEYSDLLPGTPSEDGPEPADETETPTDPGSDDEAENE